MGAVPSRHSQVLVTDDIALGIRRLAGLAPITQAELLAILQRPLLTVETVQQASVVEEYCRSISGMLLDGLDCGNFALLINYIIRTTTELLKDLDAYAPSKTDLTSMATLKNAILYLRYWIRIVLDEKSCEYLLRILDGDAPGSLEESDIAEDVFLDSPTVMTRNSSVKDFKARTVLSPLSEDISTASQEKSLSVNMESPLGARASLWGQVTLALARVAQVDLVPCTRGLLTETVRCLLVLMSCDMRSVAANPFFARIQRHRSVANALVTALVRLAISPPPPPPAEAASLVSELVSVIASPWSMLSSAFTASPPKSAPPSLALHLATESAYLLLALIYSDSHARPNACMAALAHLTDSDAHEPLQVPFSQLFNVVWNANDTSLLLIYSLLYNNESFYGYVVSHTADLDQLALPLLQKLYEAEDCAGYTVYVIIVILLMLSQDDQFVEAMFSLPCAQSLDWFTDRSLKGASVGDLAVLVLVRLVQANMTHERDEYVNNTCFAALCNMAPRMSRLHPYASQRLVALFTMLAKHLVRVGRRHTSEPAKGQPAAWEAAVVAFETVLVNLLRVVTTVLACRLRHNTSLVYSVLVDKDAFFSLSDHFPKFAPLVSPVRTLVAMIEAKFDPAQKGPASVETVMDAIASVSAQLPDDRLARPRLPRYEYEQTVHPSEFFQPSLWALVLQQSPFLRNDLNYPLFQ